MTFICICIVGGVCVYLKSLIDIVVLSDLKQKREIEFALVALFFVVMFGGIAITYKYFPPF